LSSEDLAFFTKATIRFQDHVLAIPAHTCLWHGKVSELMSGVLVR